MSRRRSLILAIVTAGCWIALLAIVRSEFKIAKQLRSKDRSSGFGEFAFTRRPNPLPFARKGLSLRT